MGAESFEPAADHQAHALGHLNRVHAQIGFPRARRVEQLPFLGQVLVDLLDEERIAFGFAEHRLRQA